MNDKMNKVKQMDKFLEMYYLSRFNQQEVETMNRQITSNNIGSIIKTDPKSIPSKIQDWWFHRLILPNI